MPPPAPPSTPPAPTTKTPRDYIREMAVKYKVDPDLALRIAEKESSGVHEQDGQVTTSSQGAQGFFQLLPSTAYGEFGLDPTDPAQNIEAGVRYLRKGLEANDYDVEAAARYYHGGPNLKLHGPKTQAYGREIVAGLRGQQTAQAGKPPTPPPNIFEQMNTRALGSIKEFGTEALASLNPKTMWEGVKALPEMAMHPVQTAEGIYKSQKALWDEGEALEQAGYGIEGRLRKSAAVIPLLGPRLGEAQEHIMGGEYAKGLGALTDVAGQVVGPKLVGKTGRARVLPRAFKPNVTAETERAVDLGRRMNVPLDVATVSGNPWALRLQRLAEGSPLGVIPAMRTARKRGEALPRAGTALAERVHPAPVIPEQAGAGLRAASENYIVGRHGEANVAYDALRAIEADPQFTRQVPTSTTKPPFFPPGAPPTPVFEAMQLPVDRRLAKVRLKPLYDQLTRQTPIAKAQMSEGLKALENLVNGPDFAPLSVSDIDLGAIKAAARGADLPELRNVSQGLASQGVQALSDAVDAALAQAPGAAQALAEGRAATTAKYAAKEVLKQLRDEPVQAFGQARYPQDTGIDFLRELQTLAPQEMPKVGRAVIEDLLQEAGGLEGGYNKAATIANKWERLGDATKQILFGGNAPDLDSFFLLAKKLGANPNPSGTALSMWTAGLSTQLMAHPLPTLGIATVAGATSALMNSKAGIALLTQGLTIPANSARAVLWGTQATRLANELRAAERPAQAAGTPPPEPPPRLGSLPPPSPPQ